MLVLMRVIRVLLQRIQAIIVTVMTLLHEIWHAVCQSCDNARWFVLNYPPIVLFVLCVAFFMFTLWTLAYYVHNNDKIRNPDVSKDWNMFLEQFSHLEMCILQHNVTLDGSLPELPKTPPRWQRRGGRRFRGKKQHVTVMPPSDDHLDTEMHSLMLLLAIQPTREFIAVQHSLTLLTASIYGKYIGMKGISKMHRLNVTMVVPYDWDSSLCSSDFTACKTVYVNACVEFLGPKNLFPHSKSKHPPRCQKAAYTGVEYRAGLNWQMPDVDSFIFCRHRSMLRVQYLLDPALTVELSQPQRTLIKLRLLRASYCLCMFITIVAGWAFIFSKFRRRRFSSSCEVVNI